MVEGTNAEDEARWLTIEEAIERLFRRTGVAYSAKYFAHLATTGQIPSRKVGRYRRFVPSEIDAWESPEPSGAPDA